MKLLSEEPCVQCNMDETLKCSGKYMQGQCWVFFLMIMTSWWQCYKQQMWYSHPSFKYDATTLSITPFVNIKQQKSYMISKFNVIRSYLWSNMTDWIIKNGRLNRDLLIRKAGCRFKCIHKMRKKINEKVLFGAPKSYSQDRFHKTTNLTSLTLD